MYMDMEGQTPDRNTNSLLWSTDKDSCDLANSDCWMLTEQ